jgi:hypothetical protein
LQEYFFKSQESLATVIDFVEEEIIDLEKTKKVVNHQNAGNSSSTQSSPREPASRRKEPQVVRRLTP